MINVIVLYKVKPEFVQTNKANIEIFLRDFQQLKQEDFKYTVFVKDDGVTFVHQSIYLNKEIQDELLNVQSFKEFQRQRDESGLDGSHAVQILELLGASGGLTS